jgi:hypothetical protein
MCGTRGSTKPWQMLSITQEVIQLMPMLLQPLDLHHEPPRIGASLLNVRGDPPA